MSAAVDYLTIGVLVGVLWALRAISDRDFRNMCGLSVLAAVALFRVLTWPGYLLKLLAAAAGGGDG